MEHFSIMKCVFGRNIRISVVIDRSSCPSCGKPGLKVVMVAVAVVMAEVAMLTVTVVEMVVTAVPATEVITMDEEEEAVVVMTTMMNYHLP